MAILSKLKWSVFYIATLIVIGTIIYSEWLIPDGSSILLRVSVAVTGFIYWVAGTSVYLYSSNHQSFGCLMLNVVGLVLILSTLDLSYAAFPWLQLISQMTAIYLPTLLLRSYLTLSSCCGAPTRHIVHTFDLAAAILLFAAVLQVYARVSSFSHIILVFIGLELTAALVVLGGLWLREPAADRRSQIRTVMFGSLIQFLVLFTLNLIGYLDTLPWMWVILSVILPLAVSVSVLRGRFMDVELHRRFIYILMTAVISGTYLTIIYLILNSLPRSYHAVLSMIAVALLSLCLIPLAQILHRLTDLVIYRDHYDFRGLLRQMAVAIPLMKDVEELGKYVCIHLTEALNLKWCAITVTSSGVSVPIFMTGFTDENGEVRSLGVSSASRHIPLQVNQRQVGEIAFASKRSHMKLRPVDEDLLTTIAHHTAVVLDNHQLVKDLQTRIQKLQETDADRRVLHRRLLESEEEARAKLSRELHDGALQSLFHLIRISEAGTETPDELLSQIAGLGRDIAFELREVCTDLRPHVLDQFHLPLAVESLMERHQDHYDIDFNLKTMVALPSLHQLVDKQVEVMLYRVVQEALSNVLRHAQATSVEITLKYELNCLYLMITDNGIGCAIQEDDLVPLSKDGHMGIIGMFERIRGLNGTMRISRGKQGGTIVEVSVPHNTERTVQQSRGVRIHGDTRDARR